MRAKTNNPKGRPPGIKSVRGSGTRTARKAPQKASKLNERGDVLEFLASVFQDENQPTEVRIKAAIAFAPYRYPKLQAQQIVHGSAGQTHEQWVKSMHRALTSSTEPELKLIEAEAVELGGAPDKQSGGQCGNT